MCKFDDIDDFEDVLMFVAPATAAGRVVDVFNSCARGLCTCVHYLDGVQCQLRPCRLAYILYGGFIDNIKPYEFVYDGICDGFKIVDEPIDPYKCKNYTSILDDTSKSAMDRIIKRELSEGYITLTDVKPSCIHALGAVPKGENDIRPITTVPVLRGRL